MVLVLFKNTVLVFYMKQEQPQNPSCSCLLWNYLVDGDDVTSLLRYWIKKDILLISVHFKSVPGISVIFIMNNNLLQKRTIWNGTGIV
jgi:hypothetical protein